MLLLPMWEKKMTVSIHKQKELIPLERHHNKYYNNDLLELPMVTLSWHGSKYMVHVLLMEVMHVVSYLPAYQVTVAVGDSGFCCCGTSFECNCWFLHKAAFCFRLSCFRTVLQKLCWRYWQSLISSLKTVKRFSVDVCIYSIILCFSDCHDSTCAFSDCHVDINICIIL